MAQRIALAAHGQWVVGSKPTRVIGGVRKGIHTQLLLCSKDKSVLRPILKKARHRVSHRVLINQYVHGARLSAQFPDRSGEVISF